MFNSIFTGVDLQLFAEGGAGVASAGTAVGGATVSTPTGKSGSEGGHAAKASGSDKDAKVIYGKVPVESPDVEENKNTKEESNPEDRKKAYADFKASYKNEFDEDVQSIVKSRLKDYKSLREKAGKQDEIIGILAQKYGAGNADELLEKMRNDESYWQSGADANDMTVEQYRKKVEMEAENARYKNELSTIRAQEAARRQYDEWLSEAAQVKAEYPEFDLNEALRNAQFRSLLSTKYSQYRPSMKQIYELTHADQIKQQLVSKTKESVVADVKARGTRPKEAASSSDKGVIYKSDVNALTKKDREDIINRVSRGEKIYF